MITIEEGKEGKEDGGTYLIDDGWHRKKDSGSKEKGHDRDFETRA